MLLAIDMGNTNIVIGCVEGEKVLFVERMETDRSKTELEYSIGIKTVLELYDISISEIEGAIISSVVPHLTFVLRDAVKKIINISPMIVGPGVKNGLQLAMDNPNTVGSDLVVDAVAAINYYGAPVIVLDMGTATTISVVDENEKYIGGMILPGVRTSLESLVNRTAQLPNIELSKPKKLIGKNTIDCMKSGTLYGTACCVDGMIDRIWEELGYKTTVVATGGLAEIIIPNCRHDIQIDQELLLKGLTIIFNKNRSRYHVKK